MLAETLYPHIDGSGRGMDDGDCIHCGVSGSLEGAECPVRLRKLIRRMERWHPYDEHGQPVTQAAYNAIVSRLATEGERMGTIARLTRERDTLRAALTRLCAHLPDGPDGTPNWEPTEPEEIAAMVERAERLLAEAGDLDVMQAQASVWEEAIARAEKAERERDDLRVDAEVLSDRYAEVRALADAYIDIVNRTARALGIPEVDEDGASPSLHDVPERVAENRRKLYWLAEVVAEFIEDGLVDGDLAACRLQATFRSEPHRQPLDGDEAARELRALMVEAGGNEPTDDDATQDPPGWGVCGKVIPGTERTTNGITSAHGCMDAPGHDGPCRIDARADGGEVSDGE